MFTKVSLLAAVAGLVSAQAPLLINTPTALIQCQPYAVTWSGGDASAYYVAVLPGGQSSAAALETLGDQPTTTNSYTWIVDIPAGTSITLRVTDATGQSALSAPVDIQASSDSSCLNGGGSSSAAASGSSSAAASSGSASSAPASSASSAASSVSSAVSSSAASSSATTAITASSSSSSTMMSSSASVPPTASGSAPAASSSAPTSGAGLVKIGSSALALAGAVALAVVA